MRHPKKVAYTDTDAGGYVPPTPHEVAMFLRTLLADKDE